MDARPFGLLFVPGGEKVDIGRLIRRLEVAGIVIVGGQNPLHLQIQHLRRTGPLADILGKGLERLTHNLDARHLRGQHKGSGDRRRQQCRPDQPA